MNQTNATRKCNFLTYDINKINQVRNTYIVATCFHGVLILPIIAFNVLLIISLYRSPELKKPSTKLLFNLAVSDLLLGLILETTLVAKKAGELTDNFHLYCTTGMVTYIAGAYVTIVSLWTLTSIAVDRLLIIHTGKRYCDLVTNRRVLCHLVVLWILALVIVTGQFYTPRGVYFKFAAPMYMTCIFISSICYLKCFVTLKKQKAKNSCLTQGIARQNIASERLRRSMFTMLYVFMFFNLCSLPFLCTTIAAALVGESAEVWGAESMATVVNSANSLINPIVLFWRMKNIRNIAIVKAMPLNVTGESGPSNRDVQTRDSDVKKVRKKADMSTSPRANQNAVNQSCDLTANQNAVYQSCDLTAYQNAVNQSW